MESASWIAVAMAAVAMVGTAVNSLTTRRTTRDKLEIEARAAREALEAARQVARDKLEFDARAIALQVAHKTCEEAIVQIRTELRECREDHIISRQERATLRADVSVLQSAIVLSSPPSPVANTVVVVTPEAK